MAEEVDPITGQKVVRVAGPAGAVSVESIGHTKYVYDQAAKEGDKPASLTDSIAGAFAAVLGSPAAAATVEDTSGQYAARLASRDDQAFAAEERELERQVAIADAADKAKTVAGDIAKGLFVEGIPAAIGGAKLAVNETLDLIDSVADKIETYVPGTVTWTGIDGDPSTPVKISLTTEEAAKSAGFKTFGNFRAKLGKAEGKQETVTGGLIQKAAQFTTGMAGAGKALKGWTAATRAGQFGKAMVAGAIADFTAFDPHEVRLSNLLQDMAPEQAKPIFDYLAADKEDGELIGRAKNALEGAGLGLAADGVMRAIRGVKAGRAARQAAAQQARVEGLQAVDVDGLAAENAAKVEADVADLLRREPSFGDKVDAAAIDTMRLPTDTASKLLEPPPGENPFGLKLDTIETADDIKALIGRMTAMLADPVNAARRSARNWQQTGEAADRLDWVSSMAARRPGEAANAETVLAYREALNASGAKLLDLAAEVQGKPGDIAAQYAFRRALAVHGAIQSEFMGARAEAGRALNAFRIPAGTPAQKLRQIDALLADAGGRGAVDDLAAKVLDAARRGDVALNQMVRQGWSARSRDMIKLVYTNGLLSGLGTPIVNVVGNAAAVLQNVAARAAAPRLAGAGSATEIGEAAAFVAGWMGAAKDAFRLSAKEAAERITLEAAREKGALRALAPGLEDIQVPQLAWRGREEAGIDVAARRPLGAAAWRVDEDTPLGRALDFLQMAVESPSNANQLADDFFRATAARAELRAQAFRQAQREVRAGVIAKDGAQARMAALLDDPTEDMLKAAEREMQDLTFTRETPGIASGFTKIKTAMDSAGPIPVGTMVMPFLRTPANIISTAMRYSPLAPFMRRYAEDMAEGGARAEIAKAQMAVGTAMWAILYDAAANGDLTGGGPANAAQRAALTREGPDGEVIWQPYSMRVRDLAGNERWISYERLDPMGSAASLVADIAEIAHNDDWDEAKHETIGEVVGHAVGALGQAFFNKTMLRSATETVEALTQPDSPGAENLLKNRAVSLVPFSAAARMFRRGDDEYMRETAGVVDAIKNTIPGLSADLPISRDLWGRPKTYQTGLGTVWDAVSPVKTKAAGGTAIDVDIVENGVDLRMPGKAITVPGMGSVSLKNRPDIYMEYVRLAGEPAFAKLNAVANGEDVDSEFYLSLSPGPDGDRARYIQDVVRDYRDSARALILDRYGDELRAMAAESDLRRREARVVVD